MEIVYKGKRIDIPLTKKGNEFCYIDSSLESAETSAVELMGQSVNPKGKREEEQSIKIANILCAIRAAKKELPALLLDEKDI